MLKKTIGIFSPGYSVNIYIKYNDEWTTYVGLETSTEDSDIVDVQCCDENVKDYKG